MDKRETREDLQWLVGKRCSIQRFLMNLYEFAERPPREPKLREQGFQILLGAGFALWRAVFLISPQRTEDKIGQNARGFLGMLLRDNAINYPQDQKSREWTAGYYVNDAMYRLERLYRLMGDEDSQHAVQIASFFDRDTSAELDARQHWELALQAASERLEKISQLGD